MLSGVLQQVGSPIELYNNPANLFVAGFSPQSRARTGEPAKLWLDASKLHFFDEQSGDALTYVR